MFTYRFPNYGKTPAHLIEFKSHYTIEGEGDLPPSPIDPAMSKGRKLPAGIISTTDFPYTESENLMAVIDLTKLAEDFSWRKYRFFFMGYVRYVDIFETQYISGFCHVYDGLRGRFVRVGDERYNYARKEAPAVPRLN
jgi:hypothetical protein